MNKTFSIRTMLIATTAIVLLLFGVSKAHEMYCTSRLMSLVETPEYG